jgi:hypothetical protein
MPGGILYACDARTTDRVSSSLIVKHGCLFPTKELAACVGVKAEPSKECMMGANNTRERSYAEATDGLLLQEEEPRLHAFYDCCSCGTWLFSTALRSTFHLFAKS